MGNFHFQEAYLLYLLVYVIGLATGAGVALWVGHVLDNWLDQEE